MLVQRLLARDEQAFRTLYERYARRLLVVLVRVVRDHAVAEDVLQEGLLKVWLSLESYDARRGPLFSWLARVCCNHAVDTLRSPRYQQHRRHRPLEVTGAQQAPAPTTFNPENIGVRELTRDLKPQQREIIELLYFQGHTQAQAAVQLGIPLGTVKTRAGAALKALLRQIGPSL